MYKSSSLEWIESRKVLRLLRHCSDKVQGLMNLLDNLIRLAINGNSSSIKQIEKRMSLRNDNGRFLACKALGAKSSFFSLRPLVQSSPVSDMQPTTSNSIIQTDEVNSILPTILPCIFRFDYSQWQL
jgi:hypothetical protein